MAALDFRFNLSSMSFLGYCNTELRSAFGIKGNADIAGAGVMASFCIEPLLATASVAVWALRHARSRGYRHKHRSTERRSLGRAFEAILPTFSWSSAVLSLGSTTGALRTAPTAYRRGQIARWRQYGAPYSLYDTQLAAIAAAFSVLPPSAAGLMLLQTPGRRRRLLKATVLPVVTVLLAPLCYLTFAANDTGIEQTLVEAYVGKTMYLVGGYTTTAIVTTLVVVTVCGLLAGVVACRGGRAKALVHIAMALLLATLWTTLALLFVARKVVIEFSGGDDPQSEWGFGQVLVLTTWIPVVIDFFYTLSAGTKKDLERYTPKDYGVVLAADVEDHAATLPRRSTF